MTPEKAADEDTLENIPQATNLDENPPASGNEVALKPDNGSPGEYVLDDTKSSTGWEPSEKDIHALRSKLSKRRGWDAANADNGDQFRQYMEYKTRKLRNQFSYEANMSVHGHPGTTTLIQKSDSPHSPIFKNVVVWVDGRTNPSRLEIRKIIMCNGGQFETYWTNRVTHVVADTLAAATAKRARAILNPSGSATSKKSPQVKLVTAQWVSQSVKMKQQMPEWQFPIPGVRAAGQTSVAALLSKNSRKKSSSPFNSFTGKGVAKRPVAKPSSKGA